MSIWDYNSLSKGRASIQYTTMVGFFDQDDRGTDPATFDFTQRDFGLKEIEAPAVQLANSAATSWQRFAEQVASMVAGAPSQKRYKVLFVGRHGEGVHNVAEAKYGTIEWDRYWSKLPGDGTSNWTDAALTELGVGQAERNGKFWQKQVIEEKMPLPQSYYSSPLVRCVHTGLLTYQPVLLDSGSSGYEPTVKEMLRETMGVHTCDERSSRKWVESTFSGVQLHFEEGFTETDELWSPDHRETPTETATRLRGLLDDIWCHDDNTWLSLTCHSGAARALLSVVGHREWSLKPGEIVPIFVMAEWRSANPRTQ